MSVLDLFRLDGKRALVTGGSRGLGREMGLALAEAGADVIITGRTEETLAATTADLRALGVEAQFIQADMGVPAECEGACQEALRRFGVIDILINNVGGRKQNVPIEEESLTTWQRMIDLNLTSCFLATRIVGGAMLARGGGGRIITIASINAFIANRGIAGRHYEAAKAAVLHFTRSAAADWASTGVTVNAICPGLFMTDANKHWSEVWPDVIDAFVRNIPAGRAGKPEEIGPLAVYLASPASDYVTGAAFVIDGGYTLW